MLDKLSNHNKTEEAATPTSKHASIKVRVNLNIFNFIIRNDICARNTLDKHNKTFQNKEINNENKLHAESLKPWKVSNPSYQYMLG